MCAEQLETCSIAHVVTAPGFAGGLLVSADCQDHEIRPLRDGDRFQVVFITVDPERDTPELLREYMAAFDPSFVALRPTPEELKKTAAEFKVYYKAVPTGSSYTMDHSAQSYLFDPQGRLRLVLRHEQTAQDYAHDVQMLLKQS